MESVGGGLVHFNFESASAEMDPEHFGDMASLSSRHSPDQQQQYDYPNAAAAGDNDLSNNFTNEETLLWANETQQCWWNGTDTLCSNETLVLYSDMYSLGFKIAIAILYNSIFVTALLGNALVCYVVFSSPRMRTVTNYLIANLAVGDLLMAVLCVPFSYIPVLLQYWPFGHFLCYLLPPAQAISVLVSSYTLVALAADRYVAILYPLRPRFRRSQVCWVIIVIWLIAIITASPIAIFTEYYPDNATGLYYCEESGWKRMGAEDFKLPYGLTLMILQYFFPLIVLIFTYSRIAMAVWGKKSLGEAEDSRDQRLAKTKRKTVVMSLAVVAGYTTAYLPFNLMVVVGLDRIGWYPQYVFFACHSLAMAHTTYNPVIYAWMNVRFRTAFLSVLSRLNLLCPCLLNLCLSRNSSPNNTVTTQYPFNSYYNSNHHSLYIRQQIYGSSAHGSNKLLVQQQPNNKQDNQQQNNKNASAAAQAAKQRGAYQLTNGSVKSNLESDPLVLISIPTDQIDNHKKQQLLLQQQNQANNVTNVKVAIPASVVNIAVKETNLNNHNLQQLSLNSSPTKKSNNHASTKINGKTNSASSEGNHIATTIITCSNKSNNSHSDSPTHMIVAGDKVIASSPPVPVEILATAKDEDMIDDNEDDCEVEDPMIKMMLTVVIIYTISWLPINIFLVYGDIWNENLYEENREVVSYIYPVIHWLAMAHSVWNPVIYCYMNSRFREGFKAAISNVPCIWKMVRFCQLRKSRRSRSNGIMTDSTRRRMSYYSHSGNTRLTRTNTTCTTYTFGSGSLHNIHNTSGPGLSMYHQHQHPNYIMNNPLVLRKQSFMNANNNGNENMNARDRNGSRPSIAASSILVSQYPNKPNRLSITNSSNNSLAAGVDGGMAAARTHNVVIGNNRDSLKPSTTMTSLAPGQSSSIESSPSSPGREPIGSDNNLVSKNSSPGSCLKQQSSIKRNGDGARNGNCANGKKKVSLKNNDNNDFGVASPKSSSLSPVIGKNSSTFVAILSKGGKEVVTTTTGSKKGKKCKSNTSSTPSSSKGAGPRSFLNRKRSSNSSADVSESFM